jgi:CelD/BcsL family acetyltransferase involved in cellulose biosynthesis
VRVIGQVEEFEALSQRWDELARRARATPFMISDYLAEVWRWTSGPVYCVVAERGDRLVGGLALRVRGRPWAREAALLAGPSL